MSKIQIICNEKTSHPKWMRGFGSVREHRDIHTPIVTYALSVTFSASRDCLLKVYLVKMIIAK